MTGQQLLAQVGADVSYLVTLLDSDGNTITGYTSGATLSCSVWSGDDQAVLFAPTASWFGDPSLGQVRLDIRSAQTGSLSTGIYHLRLQVTAAGYTYDGLYATLRLQATPGAASPRPTYCTADHLNLYAPWLSRIQDLDQDQAGFAEQRAHSRDWFDDLILRAFRGGSTSISAFPCTAFWGQSQRRTGQANPYIKQLLANNQLIVTRKVIEATALYAIALVCQAQLMPGTKNPYGEMADTFLRRAEDRASTITAEIDLNGDGLGDIIIELGTSDVLWG